MMKTDNERAQEALMIVLGMIVGMVVVGLVAGIVLSGCKVLL